MNLQNTRQCSTDATGHRGEPLHIRDRQHTFAGRKEPFTITEKCNFIILQILTITPSGQTISINIAVTCNMFNFHINITDSTNQPNRSGTI